MKLTLEAVRLSSVIVTVVHLLALAVNHYVGIVKPLHYAGIFNSTASSFDQRVLHKFKQIIKFKLILV